VVDGEVVWPYVGAILQGIVAENVAATPHDDIASTNVQGQLEEIAAGRAKIVDGYFSPQVTKIGSVLFTYSAENVYEGLIDLGTANSFLAFVSGYNSSHTLIIKIDAGINVEGYRRRADLILHLGSSVPAILWQDFGGNALTDVDVSLVSGFNYLNIEERAGLAVYSLSGRVKSSTLTTRGDLLVRDASGLTRIPKGDVGTVLTMGADDPLWAAPAGGGGMELLHYEAITQIVSLWTCPVDVNITMDEVLVVELDGTWADANNYFAIGSGNLAQRTFGYYQNGLLNSHVTNSYSTGAYVPTVAGFGLTTTCNFKVKIWRNRNNGFLEFSSVTQQQGASNSAFCFTFGRGFINENIGSFIFKGASNGTQGFLVNGSYISVYKGKRP
jgi:hypothetical protein